MDGQHGLMRRQLCFTALTKNHKVKSVPPNPGTGAQPTDAGSLCAPESQRFPSDPQSEQSLRPSSAPPALLPDFMVPV